MSKFPLDPMLFLLSKLFLIKASKILHLSWAEKQARWDIHLQEIYICQIMFFSFQMSQICEIFFNFTFHFLFFRFLLTTILKFHPKNSLLSHFHRPIQFHWVSSALFSIKLNQKLLSCDSKLNCDKIEFFIQTNTIIKCSNPHNQYQNVCH